MRPPHERATSSGMGRDEDVGHGRPSIPSAACRSPPGGPVASAWTRAPVSRGAAASGKPPAPTSGTKTQAPAASRSTRCRGGRRASGPGDRGSPTGMTSRPPSASWSRSACGIDGAAAVTMIPSYGAPAGSPRLPSPIRTSTRSPRPSSTRRDRARVAQVRRGARCVVTRAPRLGEDRRLVAGARPELEDPVAGAGARSSVIRATMYGWLIVWPALDRQGLVGVRLVSMRPRSTKRSRGMAAHRAAGRARRGSRGRAAGRGPSVRGSAIGSRRGASSRGYVPGETPRIRATGLASTERCDRRGRAATRCDGRRRRDAGGATDATGARRGRRGRRDAEALAEALGDRRWASASRRGRRRSRGPGRRAGSRRRPRPRRSRRSSIARSLTWTASSEGRAAP